jgi:hypothetical protein
MPTYTISLPNGKQHIVSSDKPLEDSDLTELTDSLMTPSQGMGNLRQREENPVVHPYSTQMPSQPLFSSVAGPAPTINARMPEEQEAIRQGNAKAIKTGLPMAAAVVAPELAVAAYPGLATTAASTALGVGGRLLAQGGISAAAESATRQGLNEGTVDPTRLAVDTGLGSASNLIIGGALWRANAGIRHVIEQWAKNGSITGVPGDFLSGVFFKRGSETAAQNAARSASDTLASTTGVQQPIVLPSDKIPEMAQDIHNARVAALQSATSLSPKASKSTMLQNAFDALTSEGIELTAKLKKATTDAVDQIHNTFSSFGLTKSQEAERVLNRLRANSTPEDAASAIGARVNSGIAEQKAAVDTAYDALRAHPDYAAAEGDLSNTQRIISDINDTALRKPASTSNPILGPNGQPLPSNATEPNLGTLGPEVKRFINEIGESVTIPQTLDRVEKWKSRLGEALGNDNDVFNTSLGKGNVKRLYGSLAQDAADIAQQANPQLAQLQSQAHALQRDFIQRNENSLIQDIFHPDRELGPRALFDRLTSKDAATKLEPLLRTAGPQRAPDILNRLREGILSDAYTASTKTDGAVDFENVISKMMSAKNNLGQRFDQMFPNLQAGYDALRKAATSTKLADKFSNPIDQTIDLFAKDHDAQSFLLSNSPRSKAQIDQYVDDFVYRKSRIEAMHNDAYTKQIMDELKNTGAANVPDLVKHVFSPTTGGGDIRGILSELGNRNPTALDQFKTHFLGELLDRSSIKVKDSVNRMMVPELLMRDLANTSATGQPGKYYNLAVDVLGKPTVAELNNTADLIRKSSGNTLFHALENENDLAGALNTISGHVSNFSRWRGLLSTIKEARYYIAGRLLKDQDTRRMLLTPVSDLSKRQVERLSNVINATLQDQVQQ